jgi:AcrR family transcriptional regulator
MAAALSRRDRLRAATVAEIKEIARRYLVADGPSAISLRAIARDMGMSAPSLYRYFPSLDTLITELTADAYDSVRSAMEVARDATPADDTLGRLVAVSRAFRQWAVAHPAEFSLAFGTPPPGRDMTYTKQQKPDDGAADPNLRAMQACGEAGTRFGAVFAQLFIELWTRRPFPTPAREEIPPRLRVQLGALAEELGGVLPMPAVFVYLSCWTQLYGMVALEVFGHQRWALTDAEPLFEAELAAMIRRLDPPAAGSDGR